MARIGDAAHTEHGPGTITQEDNLGRGGKQFRVAGRGFDVWVPEIRLRLATGDYTAGLETTIDQGEVNDDNSTTLPYDPSPQYPVDLFAKEQTILPGDHEIDPDDRLHPSDSLSKNRADANRPYPGPSPDLFARGASYHYAEEEPFQGDPYKEWGEDEWHDGLPDGPERTFDAAYRPAGLSERYAHVIEPDDERNPITAFRRDPVEFMQRRAYVMTAGEEDHLYKKFADYDNLLEVEASRVGGFDKTSAWGDVRAKAQRLRHEGRVHINHVTPQHIYATVNGDSGTYDTMIIKGASGAFSGGQSIANWSCDCEWGKWAFQRKASYVGRLCSHAYAAYLDMQSHTHKDNGGRFKAASIVDDFKSWAKENNDGHMDRGSMTDFINTCEKRVTKEQADELYDHLNKNTQVAPERDYDVPYTFDNEEAYKKTADALRQRPLSLTPDFREVPKDDENKWTDVTEDDRETTGPDQIVHFGALAARLHTADSIDDLFGDAAGAARGVGKGLNDFGQRVNDDVGGVSKSVGKGLNDVGQHINDDISTTGRGVADSSVGKGLNDFGQRINDDIGSTGRGIADFGKSPQPPQGGLVSDVTKTPPGAGGFGNWDKFNDMAKSKGLVNDQGQVQGGPPVTQGTPNPYSTVTTNGAGGAPPAGAAPPAGPKTNPTSPTWFPKQESTTTNTDPTSPWTRNTNDSALLGNDYKIQRGDTLNDIANRSGLSVQDIQKANTNITDPNKINAGDTLKLPGGPGGMPGSSGGQGKLPSDSTFNALGEGADALGDDGKVKTPKSPAAPAGTNGPSPGKLPSDSTFNALGEAADSLGDDGKVKAPQLPQPPKPPGITSSLAYRLHMAADDDDNDDDDRRPDTGEAAAKLDRLRQLSEEDQSDHYQDMDSYNEEIRDLVEDLNEAGVDAMPFVAHRLSAPQGQRKDNDPSDGDANFAGQSNPNWADEPFNGSGPDPQLWMSDSASYIDEHERPDFTDVTDLPDGDIIKFNDSRSAPQQGPRHGSRHQGGPATLGDYSNMNGFDAGSYTDGMDANGGDGGIELEGRYHYADDDDVVGDGTGYFNPDNPSRGDWEEGSGEPFMNEMGHATDQMNPLHGLSGGGGEEGGAGGAALAEEAPELLALASRSPDGGGFSLEAFDRGEFRLDGGELHRANRAGGGPTQQVRVDPGGRGWKKQAETYNPPENFGNDGDPDLAAYSGDAGASPGMTADIVASFQRSAGALSMMHGGQEVRPGSLDDFSSSPMVQSMLRTAGRKFSPEEQRMLEAEAHPMGARNLPTDDELAGTHYLL